MIQATTIDYEAPPAHEYLLQATFPVAHDAPGPWTVDGAVSDSRVIARTPEFDIVEVSALVPAGTETATVRPGRVAGAGVLGVHAALALDPGTLALEIDGSIFPLTDPAHFKRMHRGGRVHATAEFHRSLGPYGHATYWITARAGTQQLDVALLWHRAIPGPGFRFDHASIVSPYPWASTLPDTLPPHLVAPGPHLMPQQRGRPFWFSVGLTAEPEHVGTARSARLLPGGFEVPTSFGHAPLRTRLRTEALDARARLAQGRPSGFYGEEGHLPVSRLWPSGGYHNAVGSSLSRLPLAGGTWAASRGSAYALELHRATLLRHLARASMRFGPSGDPLDLPAVGEWSFWDGFSGGYDAPWEWDAYHNPTGPQDPRVFSDVAIDDLTRIQGSAWALAILANDPLALRIAHEQATRGRLTFFEGPGRAHRLDVPAVHGRGSDIGRWQASAALSIAFARATGRTEYEPWRAVFLAHLRAVQMPSGCFTRRVGGYPSTHDPFHGDYALQGGSEFAYLALAAHALGDGDLARSAMECAAGIATDDDDPGLYYYAPTGHVDGTLYQDEDDWPQHLKDWMGVPGNLSYYTALDMGYVCAVAHARGSAHAGELTRRFVWGAGSGLDSAAAIRAWGVEAPDAQTRATFENWWPLLGAVE